MKRTTSIILIIFVLSFFYRSHSLNNRSFWVDEFSSGVQAINYVSFLKGNSLQTNIEHNNYLSHFIMAVSFLFFSVSENAARLPFIIIGSLVPILIYFLAKKTVNKKVAIAAALLIAFSYFEITWSNQARGYVLQQLISTSLFLAYINFLNNKNKALKSIFILIILSLLGLLTHNMFVLPVFAIIFHYVIFNLKKVLKLSKNPLISFFTIVVLGLFIYMSSIYKIFTNDLFSLFNNLWYYHALFWREYALISFLALIGIIWGLKKNFSFTTLLLFFVSAQLIFVTFFFGHYMSKYVFPIFHFILLFAGMGIAFIAESLTNIFNKKRLSTTLTLLLTCFLLINGDKFVTKPKTFYSVNHDMRDIALIDYHQVYGLIEKKGGGDLSNIAIIETWLDRPRWYLGANFSNIYIFRWTDAGMHKRTNYLVNDQGEKYIPQAGSSLIRFIGELSDLHLAMSKYPKGFIWIDDTSLPADVINYVKENFKEELYLESYPPELLENPYSIWPGTLYSWGFETENPFYL